MSLTALIDSDSLIYSIAYGKEDESEESAIAALDETIYLMCEDIGADYNLFFLSDSTHDFRKDLAPWYKAGRKSRPDHYQCLRQHLIDVWCADVAVHREADDTLSLNAVEHPEHEWVLVHIDKDIDQVPGDHYNYTRRERYYVSKWQGLYNYYTQLLTGDRVDNIPPCQKGKTGPKTAEKMLSECKTEEDLYNVVRAAFADDERLYLHARLLWLLSTNRTNLILENHGRKSTVGQDRPSLGSDPLRSDESRRDVGYAVGSNA